MLIKQNEIMYFFIKYRFTVHLLNKSTHFAIQVYTLLLILAKK